MVTLRIKATECICKKNYRRLKVQFINSLNDEVMTAEKMKDLTAIKDSTKIKSEKVLLWFKRVGAKKSLTAMLESITDNKNSCYKQDKAQN